MNTNKKKSKYSEIKTEYMNNLIKTIDDNINKNTKSEQIMSDTFKNITNTVQRMTENEEDYMTISNIPPCLKCDTNKNELKKLEEFINKMNFLYIKLKTSKRKWQQKYFVIKKICEKQKKHIDELTEQINDIDDTETETTYDTESNISCDKLSDEKNIFIKSS